MAAYMFTGIGEVVPTRYPPVSAPSNLCGRLSTDLVKQLVPAPKAPEAKVTRNGDESRATCFFATDKKRAPTMADGMLNIELARHGGDDPATARRTLRGDFEARARTPQSKGQTEYRVASLGDAATVLVDTSIDRWYVITTVDVLVGTETLRVEYTATPGDAARTGDATVTMAREVLARS